MTMEPQARYTQVAAYLRQLILDGTIAPGQPLPSESALAQQFELSRPMVNRAVRVLIAEGLVTVHRGRGSFVREQRPVLHMSSSYVTADADGRRGQWQSELARQGLTGSQRVTGVEVLEHPALDIAGYLHLADTERVVVRRRVMLLAGTPVQLADSYYPASLAADTELSRTARMPGGTIAALERLGVRVAHFEEHIGARMPLPHEIHHLEMQPGTPVIDHTRVTFGEDGRPVEVSRAVMRADQNRLTYVLPARL